MVVWPSILGLEWQSSLIRPGEEEFEKVWQEIQTMRIYRLRTVFLNTELTGICLLEKGVVVSSK